MSLNYSFSCDCETFFNLMTDPDVLVERSLACGELSADIEVKQRGKKTLVSMNRQIKRELPAMLAKLFDSTQTMIFEEEWQAAGNGHRGKYTMNVVGQPVQLEAKFTLSPKDSGCEYQIDHSCKVKIPLIGGKVEKFVLSSLAEGVDAEMEFMQGKL